MNCTFGFWFDRIGVQGALPSDEEEEDDEMLEEESRGQADLTDGLSEPTPVAVAVAPAAVSLPPPLTKSLPLPPPIVGAGSAAAKKASIAAVANLPSKPELPQGYDASATSKSTSTQSVAGSIQSTESSTHHSKSLTNSADVCFFFFFFPHKRRNVNKPWDAGHCCGRTFGQAHGKDRRGRSTGVAVRWRIRGHVCHVDDTRVVPPARHRAFCCQLYLSRQRRLYMGVYRFAYLASVSIFISDLLFLKTPGDTPISVIKSVLWDLKESINVVDLKGPETYCLKYTDPDELSIELFDEDQLL